MRPHPLIALIALIGLTWLAGCAGGLDVRPLLQDFDRYENDLQARDVSDDAAPLIEAGRRKRSEAGALVESGKHAEALPLVEDALADARLALEMQRMHAAAHRADGCRLEVAQARDRWEEALYALERTETFAGTKANVMRNMPDPGEMSVLPGTTLDGEDEETPADAGASWDLWQVAARDRGVAVADLRGSYERNHATAGAEKVEPAIAEHRDYVAGRSVQALECRVRAAAHEEVCARAAKELGDLSDARAEALRATLDLERGMQEGLRNELDQLRAEARSRQDELFDALSQMEGKFANIRREARGTIVSLADILFDFNKATLRRDVEFNLVKIATILNQFGEMGILIEGHTDSIGTDEYNLELSKRRAKAVFDFLLSQDVVESRMTWEGYGESRPVAENETDQGRQRNRRVDLVIQDAP
jgi:outer membrane protein OmpA-like peptidoglycan-associated protein